MKKIAIATLSLVLLTACGSATPEKQLAKCLTDKGIKVFGAKWCPHCPRQEAEFGDAWKYIDYVDCSHDKGPCSRAGVEEFPSWFFPEGRLVKKGHLRPDMLANFSGCPYVQEKEPLE